MEEDGCISKHRASEALRSSINRLRMSDEQRKVYNQKSAERMRRKRQRDKENMKAKENKRMYKSERETFEKEKAEMRLKWALQKRQQRARKKMDMEEDIGTPIGRSNVVDHTTDVSDDECASIVNRSIRATKSWVKRVLPKDDQTWVTVMTEILSEESLRKKKLCASGLVCSPRTCRRRLDAEHIISKWHRWVRNWNQVGAQLSLRDS